MKVYEAMMLKKKIFNLCIDAAISKAKLSATLISMEDVTDIVTQLEKIKK